MTATTTCAGTASHDYEVAVCKFEGYAKSYRYWVPKAWNVQPGDVLKVSAPSGYVTVVHSGDVLPTGSHKLAISLRRRKVPEPKVTGSEPSDSIVLDMKFAEPVTVGPDEVLIGNTIYQRSNIDRAYRSYLDDLAIHGKAVFRLKPQPTKDTDMNIEARTYVNGTDIKTLTDDQLFDLIAAEEAKIKALRAIENKPQKLKDRINKMQADIEQLIQLIDER